MLSKYGLEELASAGRPFLERYPYATAALGGGDQGSPKQPQVMATDASGPRLVIEDGEGEAITAEDLQMLALQSSINDLKAQGVDVTSLQQQLDDISRPKLVESYKEDLRTRKPLFEWTDGGLSEFPGWYRSVDGTLHNAAYSDVPLAADNEHAPLEIDIIGGTPESKASYLLGSGAMRLPFDDRFYNDIGVRLGVGSAVLGATADASHIWRPQFRWSIPHGYIEHFVGTGGKPMAFIAEPKLQVAFVRQSDLVSGVGPVSRMVGKIAGPLEVGSVLWEAGFQTDWSDWGDIGHLSVSAGLMVAGGLVSAPVMLTVGVAWGVADYYVQKYTYNGQSGWRALGASAIDYLRNDYSGQVQQTLRVDPNFYREPKY